MTEAILQKKKAEKYLVCFNFNEQVPNVSFLCLMEALN